MSKPDDETLRLADLTERQLQLPPGLVSRFIENGGQLDKRSMAKVLDAHGIDPSLNKRNAVEAVGLALQDSMRRNGNEPTLAVAELYSGQDRKQWNRRTNDFASRVATVPVATTTPAVVDDTQQSMMPAAEIAAVEARNAPQMAPAAEAAPVGAPLAGEGEAVPVGRASLDAYRNGTMPAADRAEFERLVSVGALAVPPDFEVGQKPTLVENIISAPGRAAGAIKEAFTGEKRRVESTEALPSWGDMPEWNQMPGLSGSLKKLAAAAASPREALQILQSNVPGVTIREDEKGNLIAYSPMAKGEFAVHPGFDKGDAVRALFTLPVYAATAATGGLPAIMAKEALVQAGVEAAQAGSGGEFNPGDIALAGAVPAALRAGGAAKSAVGSALRKSANAALDAVPGSTTRAVADAAGQAVEDVTQVAAQGVDDAARVAPAPTRLEALAASAGTALRKRMGPAAEAGASVAPTPPAASVAAAGDVAGQAARAVDPTATQAIPGVAPAATEEATKEIGADIANLIRTASGKGAAADKAKAELAKAFEVSPAALESAQRLGVDVPVDVLADNVQLKNIVGSMRAKVGTKAEADFAKSMGDTVEKIDTVLADLGAESSPAGMSDRVLERFREVQGDLLAKAKDAYAPINAAVKASDNVTLDNLAAIVAQRRKDLGGQLDGIDAQMAAIVERAKVSPTARTNEGVARATFGVIKKEKAQIRKALERMESAYGSAEESVLEQYQAALIGDELANVGRIGGDALAERARLANRLYKQKKDLDKKITETFGKQESGDISRLLLTAVTDASKGSVGKLNKLLEVLPKDMHGEALMTALGSLTRAKGGAAASAGSFGAAEFTALFRGLRAKGNEKIYARIVDAVGPERANVLRDVYEISRRVTDARAAIKGTGKDTQDALANIAAENLVGAVLGTPIGKQAARGAGAVAGAALGGLPGAGIGGAAADAIMSRIAKGGEQQIVKAGELMMSPEFKALAVATVGGVDTPAVKEAVRKVVVSKPWREYAKAVNLSRDPKVGERFLLAALQSGKGQRE